MNHEPQISKLGEVPARKPWHFAVVVCGSVLFGFVVAILACTLVTSFFPGLSLLGRVVLLLATTAVLGFALVWLQLLESAQRDEVARKDESIVHVSPHF